MEQIKKTLSPLNRTVETTLNTVEAVADTGYQGVSLFNNTGKIANDTLKNTRELTNTAFETTKGTIEDTNKLRGKLFDLTGQTLDNTGEFTNEAFNQLNNELKHIGELNKNIMNMTNDTIKKASPHLSNTVGNTTEIASNLTNVTNNSIKFGESVIGSLFSVIEYPFLSIKSKIEQIKNNKDEPMTKIKKIKNEIKNNFSVIKKNTLYNFRNQLNNLMKNIEIIIQSYKMLSCKKRKLLWGYDCDENIHQKLIVIENIKNNLKMKINHSINIIENILIQFDNSIETINIEVNNQISDDEFLLKINELQNESQKIQANLLKDAILQFNEILKEYNSEINKIQDFVKTITEKISNELSNSNDSTVQEPVVSTNGGSKNRNKSKTSKQSKKSKKINNKSKKSKKSKK